MDAPTDNLVRSSYLDRAATVDDQGKTLFGHFSMFNNWYEVSSAREGRFLERIAPGAFSDTLVRNLDRIKVLYDHGFDPQLGNKPLGPIRNVGEDDEGAFYEVELIDTSYNRDFVIPAARAGLLGSSFRFSVNDGGDNWSKPTRSADHNPEKLRERTITSATVYEFGPVSFPANPAATAGIRSGTDEWFDRLLSDPRTLARFVERVGPGVINRLLDSMPADGRSIATEAHIAVSALPADGGRSVRTKAQRLALAQAMRQIL